MKKIYHHLSQAERIEIEKYLEKGFSAASIATLLGRSKSTISRELNRRPGRSYSAYDSHMLYARKLMEKNYGRSKIKSNKPLLKIIHSGLRKKWSPQQIILYLNRKYPNDKNMSVCNTPHFLDQLV